MRGYNRQNFKLSFAKERMRFFVNEKKGTVCCVVETNLKYPVSVETPFVVFAQHLEVSAVAKCHGDKFNVERGKRIALAKAENKAYKEALKFLNKVRSHLEFFLSNIDGFEKLTNMQLEHNAVYIDSVSNTNNPNYKEMVSKVKGGITVWQNND